MARKPRKRIKLRHLAIGIPLFCLIGGYVFNVVTQNSAQATVERELEKLRALGVPTEPEEMQRIVDPAENAATLYDQAQRESAAATITLPPTPSGNQSLDFAALEQYLVAQSQALALVRRGSKLPHAIWEHDWTRSPFIAYPELSTLKSLSRMAILESQRRAHLLNFGSSFEWLRVGLRIAVHARAPNLFPTLVSSSIESSVWREFQGQLSKHGGNPGFLVLASIFVNDVGSLPSLLEGLKGGPFELRSALEAIGSGRQNVFVGLNKDFETSAMINSMKYSSVRTAVEARMLTIYREAFDSRGAGGYRSETALAKVLDSKLTGDSSWIGQIIDTCFPPLYVYVAANITRVEAYRRLSKSAVHLWKAKAEQGAFPSKLPSGTDPFTDQPFVFKQRGKSFQLYSVGANMQDDGGAQTSGSWRSDDIELVWSKP